MQIHYYPFLKLTDNIFCVYSVFLAIILFNKQVLEIDKFGKTKYSDQFILMTYIINPKAKNVCERVKKNNDAFIFCNLFTRCNSNPIYRKHYLYTCILKGKSLTYCVFFFFCPSLLLGRMKCLMFSTQNKRISIFQLFPDL